VFSNPLHPPPTPSTPTRPLLARRTLMVGAGTAALLASAGCNPFSTPTRVTQTVTAAAAPVADPIPTLIATTRLHLVRLTNSIAADKTLIARLTPLRDDRQAHLTELIAELARSSPQAATAQKAAPTTDPSISVPGSSVLILAGMGADAAQAQGLFTDAFPLATRYRAALFGSIAACLASHRVALATTS
jgi:hypothetical protein